MTQTSLKNRMLEAFRTRVFIFIAAASFGFFVLFLQLINLQLIHGEEYSLKARMNMENNIPIPASRGELYDRRFRKGVSGAVLVSNRPSFNLTLIPETFESKDQMRTVLDSLSELVDIDVKHMMTDIKRGNPWERVVIKDDVDFEIIVKIASHRYMFPNISWEDAPVRVYNYGDLFAHSIGYIGSITKKEYKKLKGSGYRYYQTIGKSGIEKAYDSQLRGSDGSIRRIVDVKNRTEGEEIGRNPVSGNNVVLTLDYQVQQAADDALGAHRGAVVVIKPATGEVIALVSKPGFDPNEIISKDNSKIIRALYKNKNKPFLNRAIQSKYPPASTFKLITAIAALETEKSYADKRYYCSGKYTLKGYRDRDFYCFRPHGSLDLYHAIAKSCSVYFYNLGYKVGPTMIMKYAGYLGLGEKTGIDIPGEISGFVPSKKWKLKTFGQPWFDGDTINLAIGQGFLGVTPLGLANMLCGVVNNGIVYKPHLVKEVYSPSNRNIISVTQKEVLREIPLSPVTLRVIKQGMRYSVTGGTSARLNYLKTKICGKTGTAQTTSKRMENRTQHAWFLGFAPFDGPRENAVVVAVFIEYGQWGAVAAVPVAEKVFARLIDQGYFRKSK